MNITGIILAAGTSSRMGSVNKLLLKYENHTIVEETLTQLVNSEIDDIVVVTGHERRRIESALARFLSDIVKIVFNPHYRLGRATSIKCAIEHIAGRADAALFMVADKPGVTSDLINKAIQRYRADRPAVLHVETPAGRGHPIIFSRTVFDELLLMEGDRVGNEVVAKFRDSLIKLKDETPQLDIDSMDDFRMLLEQQTNREMQ